VLNCPLVSGSHVLLYFYYTSVITKKVEDRLVSEMRFLGINCVEEASKFLTTHLPKYNRRCTMPVSSEGDLLRPTLHSRELGRIHCIKEERTVKTTLPVLITILSTRSNRRHGR
jgi:hypothetical protein